MLITDKVYFTSTLIQAAGCGSETFRAWRNRNGLFPETQGKAGWNKFSIVDVMVATIVTELTKRGLMAQTAVDAGNAAAPLLAKVFGDLLSDVDRSDLDQIFDRLAGAISNQLQIITFNVEPFGERKVTARFQSRKSIVNDNLVTAFAIVLDTVLILVPIFRLKMNGAEIETEAGGRTCVPGLPPPELDPILRAIQAGNWQNAAPEQIPSVDGISEKATTKGKPHGKPRSNAAAKRGQ